MPKQRINPKGVATPTGYTHVVKAGNTVYVAGQVALDANGNLVGKGDAAAQADQVFRNLQACLASAGASLGDLVKITAYLTRAEDIPAYRQARSRWLTQDLPGSTLVVVSRLANPDFLVEVEGTAVVG